MKKQALEFASIIRTTFREVEFTPQHRLWVVAQKLVRYYCGIVPTYTWVKLRYVDRETCDVEFRMEFLEDEHEIALEKRKLAEIVRVILTP